jgi:lactobin A/cerein 7B family class IIb bacteriocin
VTDIRELDPAEMERVEGGMWPAICFVGGFIFVVAAFS